MYNPLYFKFTTIEQYNPYKNADLGHNVGIYESVTAVFNSALPILEFLTNTFRDTSLSNNIDKLIDPENMYILRCIIGGAGLFLVSVGLCVKNENNTIEEGVFYANLMATGFNIFTLFAQEH